MANFDQELTAEELRIDRQDLLETLQEIDYQLKNMDEMDDFAVQALLRFVEEKLDQYGQLD